MSMRALFAAASEFSSLLNEVGASSRILSQQQMERVRDLTRDEVFWIRAQALITGFSSSAAGLCNIAPALIPNNAQIGQMSAETIKTIVKTFGSGCTVFGDVSTQMARGEGVRKQSERSLVERCDIARLQQDESSRTSSYSQMMQLVQGIMSAKARLSS